VSDSTDYVRFIILSGPRTGSHMLAQALNSSPHIVCFREVFNFLQNFIQFEVEGYDNFDPADLSLRQDDPVRFLDERIFGRHPDPTRAAGFKLHYGQTMGYPGLLERLVEDEGIRVIHLRRRNLLRMLVSLRLAERTGVFLVDSKPTVTPATVSKAIRHPAKAVGSLRRRLRQLTSSPQTARPRVRIPPEELFDFIVRTRIRSGNWDELFHAHPKMEVFYEDLLDRREEVFDEAQPFLGVDAEPLTVTMRKQNPEPLRELVENFDELYDAFKHAPEAAYFD
jgi:hypothetical protein